MKTSSPRFDFLTVVSAFALLLLPFAAPADASFLLGFVRGDNGFPVDDAEVQISGAAPADSFEEDFDGWEFRQDIPNLSVAQRSTEAAFDGETSLLTLTTGRFDDGTAWFQKRFFLAPNTTYQIHLSWYQTNLATSDIGRWPVVGFAGTEQPEGEADFTEVGLDSAAEDFTRYELSQELTTDSSGQIVLAFGVSVVFEVDRAHLFDFVRPSIIETDDVIETTTNFIGKFFVPAAPGEYRVSAEKNGYLSDVAVPVEPRSRPARLELIRIEDVWSNYIQHFLREDDGEESLTILVSLVTPSGVRLDGARCLADLDLGEDFIGILTAESNFGFCVLEYAPDDGTVPRGTATFELLDVLSPGKTHAPERSDVNPAKFEVH